jgi:cysteine-rich repeat protein
MNTDDDCSAMCGNGVLEAGELCDTGITLGAGACPTTCDDGVTCTADTLTGAGSCGATCANAPITTPVDGDGCCPTAGNPGIDDDCLPTCGNGFVDLGETCDTAIPSGAGACPTACSDGAACTSDTLVGAGTCTAACSFPTITTPTNGDGCCPTGANNTDDDDCAPSCGNGVVEGTEPCDDGNMNDTDACTNSCMTNTSPTAFRFTDLDLRDPHVWLNLTCQDVTDTQFFGISVNALIQQQITLDGNNDDLYDRSPTIVLRPLDQAAGTTSAQLYFADCTTHAPSACSPGSAAPLAVTATSQTTGTCLAPIAGTTKPYSPGVTPSTAPCFSTSATTVTVNIGGIPLTLTDARLGATYVGTPATSLTNGLLMGFISEADADATMVPLPVIGSVSLSSLLAGGTGNCKTPTTSDKDVHDGVTGWWFYLNFTATQAGWSDN